MPADTHVGRASWTLIDQGVVSIGSFLANILLARELTPAEYGTFALVYGAMLALQLVSASLVFYPLSVRCAVLREDRRLSLMGLCTALTAALCVPIGLILTTGLLAANRGDLVLPTIAWLALWQMQEVMRRGLFATFRHQAALVGDVAGYLGQGAGLFLLMRTGLLTLPNAILAMAAAYGLGGILHSVRVAPSFRNLPALGATLRDFWSIGGWSLANNLTGLARLQVFAWVLAASGGPAAAAGLQAVVNLINVGNPIVIGLCNVMPQVAARERHAGAAGAWRAVRVYALIGVLPLAILYAAALLWPDLLLLAFYGAQSPYLGLALPVQILAVAWIGSYFADAICSYLHGMDAARLALLINLIGTATAIAAGIPLIAAMGLTGGCLALVAASLTRAVAAYLTLHRLTRDERTPLSGLSDGDPEQGRMAS